MPDSRAIPSYYNGKLIYQLTSASALKETDLFAISTSDNLTRNVTVHQVKSFITNGDYTNEDIDNMYQRLMDLIKQTQNQIVLLQNDITEFRNEFNNKLNQLNQNLLNEINTVDSKLTESINNLDESVNTRIDNEVKVINNNINNLNVSLSNRITKLDTDINNRIDNEVNTINNSITNLDTSLSKKISDLDTKLESWILYGTAIPTSLPTGRLYLQYF